MGYFTGDPNGDIYLISTTEGITNNIHYKVKDGKEISGNGKSIPLDNPKAFDGWTD